MERPGLYCHASTTLEHARLVHPRRTRGRVSDILAAHVRGSIQRASGRRPVPPRPGRVGMRGRERRVVRGLLRHASRARREFRVRTVCQCRPRKLQTLADGRMTAVEQRGATRPCAASQCVATKLMHGAGESARPRDRHFYISTR